MPDDEVTQTAVTEPVMTDDAPVDTPGGTGDEPADRDSGFLSILEGKQPEAAEEVEEPTKPEPDETTKEKVEPESELPLEAPQPEDDDEDDDTILSREELDKRFTNSPKGLRKYADNLGKKYAPVAAVIDELGGVDAVKRLDAVSTLVMSSPSRPDAPEVVDFVKEIRKMNPVFASQLNTNVFYGALDEDPSLMESVVKLPRTFDEKGKPTGGFGPNWSVEKLMKLTQLVDDGEIDLDDALEVANRKVDPEELARRKAQADADKGRDDEIASLRQDKERTVTLKKEAVVKSDVDELSKSFSETSDTVWRRFKLLPVEGDPEEVKKMKENLIKEIIIESSYELNTNPVFRSLDAMIQNQSYDKESDSFVKGDGYTFLQIKANSALKAKRTEIAMRKLPLFTAYLKQYNQPAASNVTKRRPEPLAEGALATEREPSPTERAQEPLSEEQRRANFQAIVEGKRQTQ